MIWGEVPDKRQQQIADKLLFGNHGVAGKLDIAWRHVRRTPPRPDLAAKNLRQARELHAAASLLGWVIAGFDDKVTALDAAIKATPEAKAKAKAKPEARDRSRPLGRGPCESNAPASRSWRSCRPSRHEGREAD